ncbi:serine hydrolase domain-containing protein, partial [Sphingomonas bacterium]|uniref:serine hydrolase domain-containing protein n=1 Tax=Sphingomonas bacterium TaxID=1895847 RepID=UPI001575937B
MAGSMTALDLVQGFCDPQFHQVAEEFRRNFDERGELGAAIAIHLDGKAVVDLWGGTADRNSEKPWEEKTSVVVFSSSKGMAAICLHML